MEKGDFVKIDYIGRINNKDGEIFDLTKKDVAEKHNIVNPKIKYGPVTIIVGGGFIIPGLDEEIQNMKVGEEKSIKIPSEKGFGERKKELVKTVPASAFKNQKVSPKVGMIVDFGGNKGRIQSITSGRVRVDFNNPLAGKDLFYEVKITEKVEDTKEKVKGISDFFGLNTKNISLKNNELEIELDPRSQTNAQQKARFAGVVYNFIDEVKKIKFSEIIEKPEKDQAK